MTQGATSPALPHFASSLGVGRAVPAVTPPRAGLFLQLEPRAPRPAGGRVSVRRLCSPHQSEAVSQGLPGAQGCGGGCRGTWRNTASAGARAPVATCSGAGWAAALHAANTGAVGPAQRLLRWRRERRMRREVRLHTGVPR